MLIVVALQFLIPEALTRLLSSVGLPVTTTRYYLDQQVQFPTALGMGINLLSSAIAGIFSVGYYNYILQLIRYRTTDMSSFFGAIKAKWPTAALAVLVVQLASSIGFALFFVPGIYIILYTAMIEPIIADRSTASIWEIIQLSGGYMNGHKMEYLFFCLSFILWLLLVGITFGIAALFVVPYIYVATAIYYEELREQFMTNTRNIL